MKRFVIYGCILSILFVIVTFFISPTILRFFHVNELLEQRIEEKLGRSVTFDNIHIKLFPAISIEIKNIRLAEHPYFGKKTLAEADTVECEMKIVPLFLKRVEVDKLIFRDARIAIREKDNKQNIQELVLDQAKQEAQTRTLPPMGEGQAGKRTLEKTQHGGPQFSISALVFENLTVLYQRFDTAGEPVFEEEVRHIDARFSHIMSDHPISFKLKGMILESLTPLEAEGTVMLDYADMLKGSEAEIMIKTRDFKIASLWEKYMAKAPCKIYRGDAFCDMRLIKVKGDPAVSVIGKIGLREGTLSCPTVEEQSYPVDIVGTIDMTMSLPFEKVTFSSLQLTMGKTNVNIEGAVDVKEQSVDVRLLSTAWHMDDFPFIHDAIMKMLPSSEIAGVSSFAVGVKGDFTRQKIKGTFSGTQNRIYIGPHIHKNEGFPFDVEMDFEIDDFQSARGPFTVDLGELTLKGDLRSFDGVSGDSECTFLTNKFPAHILNECVPLLQAYDITGEMKVVTNAKGTFRDLAGVTYSVGITVDDVGVRHDDLVLVDSLKTDVECNEYKIELNNIECFLKDGVFQGWITVLGYREKPNVQFDITATQCNIDDITMHVEHFLEQIQRSKDKAVSIESTEKVTKDISVYSKNQKQEEVSQKQSVPREQKKTQEKKNAISWLEHLKDINGSGAFYAEKLVACDTAFQSARFVCDLSDGIVTVKNISAQAFEGAIEGSGVLDLIAVPYAYEGSLQSETIKLGPLFRFIEKDSELPEVVSGKLSTTTEFSGRGFQLEELEKYLNARGIVRLRDGELKKIDILSLLATVKQLFGLKKRAYGTTRFDTIEASFTVDHGKATSQDIHIASEDFTIKGGGSLSLRGDLNYKLDVLLSEQLSQKIFSPVTEGEAMSIPIAITGTLMKPHYSVAGALVQKLVGDLIEKGLQSLLKHVQPEQEEATSPVVQTTSPAERVAMGETEPSVVETKNMPMSEGAQETRPIGDESTITQDDDANLEDVISLGLDLLLGEKE